MVSTYITSSAAAAQLGMSKCTLLRAVHRGELRAAHRTPGGQFRFDPDDLAVYAMHTRALRHIQPAQGSRTDLAGGLSRLAALPIDATPLYLTNEVLALVAESLDGDAVVLARLDDAALRVEHTVDRTNFGLRVGMDLGGDYGMRLLTAPHPLVVADTRADPRFAALAMTHLLGLGAYAGVPLRHADGQLYGILCLLHREVHAVQAEEVALLILAGRALMHARDQIAERARQEQIERDAAMRAAAFATVLDHLPCGVVAVDAAGRITFVNERGRQMVGTSLDLTLPLAAQASAFGIRPLSARDDTHALAPADTPIARALAGEVVPPCVGLVHLPGASKECVLETSATPVRTAAGDLQGAIAIFTDVTTREQAGQALRASEARFRTLYEHAPIGVALLDTQGRVRFANAALQHILGYAETDLCRMSFADVTHPDDLAADWSLYHELMAGTRESYTLDKRYLHKDGHLVWGHLAVSVTRDPGGSPQTIIGMVLDVTERRLAETHLQQSELQYRRITETTPDGIWQIDAENRTTFVNQAMADMLGYSTDDMQGMPVLSFVPPAEQAAALRRLASRREGVVERVEACYLHKDGRAVHTAISANAVWSEEGAYLGALALVRDITTQKRMEAEVRASDERFRALSEHATDLISVFDAGGTIRYASPSYQALLGYAPEEVVGRRVFTTIHPEDAPDVQTTLTAVLQTAGRVGTAEFRMRRRDGTWRSMEATAVNQLADPAIRRVIATMRDITERQQAEAAIRDSEARFRALFEQAAVGIALESLEGRILRVNERLSMLLGYSREALVGRSWTDLTHQDDIPANQQGLARLLTELDAVHVADMRYLHKDGQVVWGHITVSAVRDMHGTPSYLVAAVEDIGPRKRAEDRLHHLAWHDALTGLPNRALLEERLQHAATEVHQRGETLAILVLGLDRFKEINDTFGHQHGDLLLRQIADRLHGELRAGDTLARLGGDEFAVLLPGADAVEALRLAQALAAALDAPLRVEQQTLLIGGTIGIVLCPEHGTETRTLLRRATVAMSSAKQDRRGAAVYDPLRDHFTPARLTMIAELRAAIAEGGLVLHYQPQVDVCRGRVCGVEALVRWPHPERGLVPPNEFIALAEQTGLIAPLTAWVLEEALRQSSAWQRAGQALTMSVNLSMWDLHDPTLVARITQLLHQHALPPERLTLELTEGTLMADPGRTVAVLERLHALGVSLAVDDFGAGYSSLAYLKRLPVDELKIDRSFVRHLATDRADAAIVASTVGLGHALGLRVVAEGIEDRAAWEQLAAMGCDRAQGYFLARPLPATALEEWLSLRQVPGQDGGVG